MRRLARVGGIATATAFWSVGDVERLCIRTILHSLLIYDDPGVCMGCLHSEQENHHRLLHKAIRTAIQEVAQQKAIEALKSTDFNLIELT